MEEEQIVKGDFLGFKEDISQFTEINNRIKECERQIKPIKTQLSELKKQKLELKKDICTFMFINELERCNLPYNSGHITFKQRKCAKPINKDFLRSGLYDFFKNGPGGSQHWEHRRPSQKADDILNYIYDNREVRVSDVLTLK